jgi:hypothetical protein
VLKNFFFSRQVETRERKANKGAKYICAVNGCLNNNQNLRRWKEAVCPKHNIEQKICPYHPPFRLLRFPSAKKEAALREQWTKQEIQTFIFGLVS